MVTVLKILLQTKIPMVLKPGTQQLVHRLYQSCSNADSVFSSPEHEVLMVSYCDQSSQCPSCVVRRQQFVLKAYSS